MPRSIPGKNRTLVLSVAVRYDWQRLQPFVQSCRRHMPDADIVFFADEISADTVRALLAEGVQVIPGSFNAVSTPSGWRRLAYQWALALPLGLCNRWIRFIDGTDSSRPINIRSAALDICSRRHGLFRDFLKLHGWRYGQVIAADCRDSVFQAPVFAVEGLHTFMETDLLRDSHFGKRWFQLTYGHSEWLALGHLPMLCAGVTLGDTASMLDYFELMTRECLRMRGYTGVDQAIHNHILHRKLLTAKIAPLFDASVINLNNIPLSALRIEQGKLLNSSGIPFSIVHQYDRVPGLALTDLTPA